MIAVPYALPGEIVRAEIDGDRARLVEVLTPSADRVPSFCKYFTTCGGCAVQTLAWPPYADWKRGLLTSALDHAGLRVEVEPMIDAHGEGRRRATFHARFDRDALGRVQTVVGFMRARSHDVVALDDCPILAPGLAGALPAARAVAQMLNQLGKPLDIVITASLEGLDVDVRGTGKLSFEIDQALIGLAAKLDLARISNHGDILIERRPPLIQMGRAKVAPAPGAFLQATDLGEETLARLVSEGVGKSRKVLDLFSGVGTFALRLADKATVLAPPVVVVTTSAPVFTPMVVGLKNTFTLQVAPATKTVPHPVERLNSAEWVPPSVMLRKPMGVAPVLASVTTCALLEVSTCWPANATEVRLLLSPPSKPADTV
jgi:23S rRNA (uracil1939-C5)-methyltransferase